MTLPDGSNAALDGSAFVGWIKPIAADQPNGVKVNRPPKPAVHDAVRMAGDVR